MADIAKINGLNLKDAAARADIAGIKDGSIKVKKATADGDGNEIISTYIKKLSVSGTQITYTRGDGSTNTIVTQDTNTTYALATPSYSGLMSSSDKKKLDGLIGTGEWEIRNVTSNYWKYSYSSSTAQAKGQINAYINSTTKMAYLTGNIYINGTATTDYSIIPVARLKSLISGFTGIDMPTQIIGQSWFYYQSTLDTNRTEYGGYIKYNKDDDALQFGRFYTQSMDSHGNWTFQPLNNVAIQFIAYVKMK